MLKKILTADQTETFLNEKLHETYHSQTGAVEEAFKKYIIPCRIKELAREGKIRILDICSGIMYNSGAALDAALEANEKCEIEITALENDTNIIKKISGVNPPLRNYRIIKNLLRNNFKKIIRNEVNYRNKNIKINLLIGDARERIKELKNSSFDAVFLDPFSPKNSPEMWQSGFFKEIYRVIKQHRILATYTCARMVRENMKKAGFSYDDGPIVGRRGPGTVGWKEKW